MNRGQISFDFMIAIMAALIFVAALQGIAAAMQQSQSGISIRNQETAIAYSISELITNSAAFSDADNFSVEYKIPYLRVFGKSEPQNCSISVSSGSIIVSYSGEEGVFTQSIDIAVPAGVDAMGQTYCGETLSISGGSGL